MHASLFFGLVAAGTALAAPLQEQATNYGTYHKSELYHTKASDTVQWDTAEGWNDLVGAGNLTRAAPAMDCKPIILIFARGTWEPGPAPGLLTGSWFANDLKLKYPNKVAVQAVKYNAGLVGYLTGGDAAGSATMAKMVKSAADSCPKSRIVMGGYSQGGQVVHRAANQLPQDASSHVKAVVIFGDPDKGRKMKNIDKDIVDTVCSKSDPICYGIPIPLGSHLTYSTHANEAATWVKNKLGNV